MKFRFPLASSTWGQEELDAMYRVIDSGMFTMGELVKQFESEFASFIGTKHCVMVNSGSSANLLMVASLFYTKQGGLRLKRGDEIIVPAVSWSTTYYPLYQYGLKLKFVDIDLNTLNYDLGQLEDAISSKTRAIMCVNLLGNPNDYIKIKEIIGNREIIILEDNCEALGAQLNEKFTGSFGIMGSHSCFFSHHISTMEGGLITTDDEELYHILLSLRAHGWTRNLPQDNFVCGRKGDDHFEESWRFVLPGYNVRPLELSGALGIQQLKRLPGFIRERRQNASEFSRLFSDHPSVQIQSEIGMSSWFGFSLILRPDCGISRKSLVGMLDAAGIESRPIVAGNFYKNEVVKYFDCEAHSSLDCASYLDRNGLFIGNHHFPISTVFDTLIDIIPK